MAYVSHREHTLVNARLYLPSEWTKDRARCRAAGVPDDMKFQARQEQALKMLDENGALLPHGWVTGDDEMDSCGPLRETLRSRLERYLLAVPSNTLFRDADVPPPEYLGRGRRPKTPGQRVDRWRTSLLDTAWTMLDVRDGGKGPLVIDVRSAAFKPAHGLAPRESAARDRMRCCSSRANVRRRVTLKHDVCLSNSAANTPARAAKSEHRNEECFQRGKSEAGLGDYQVRNWLGGHHHQTLSLIAAWFFNEQTRREKTSSPAMTVPQARRLIVTQIEHQLQSHTPTHTVATAQRWLQRNELARVVASSETNNSYSLFVREKRYLMPCFVN